MTRREGGVILQTASQHAFSSAKICKFSQKISNISPRFCKIQRILTIICVLPQFRQNSMKIAAKMTDLNENSAKFKFCKNHEKIAKINGAKDCKFEFRAVQRNADLVETLLDLTFFPESPPIHEKPSNHSFSNREHAFSLSLPLFEFLNFYKTAGDGGVGRAGIFGNPRPPVASVNRHFPNKERMIYIIYPGRFHARNLPELTS